MELRCSQCGTMYDVSQYSPGRSFACQCGRTLEVGATETVATGGLPPIVTSDPGLSGSVKALLFLGNLCAWPMPIISLIAWFLIRDTKPRTADDVCKYTWIPFVIFILLFGLYIVFVLGISMISEAGGF